MGPSSLDSTHNLTQNKLWQKQNGRLRCIPPISSSASSAPSGFFPTSHSYLLRNFTLTFHNPCRAGNAKATFQSASTPQKDNRSPCHFPIQEINSGSGKSNNLQWELLLLRRPYDLILQYQTHTRWGKPVSSASLCGYHLPTGRQTQGRGSLGRQIACCTSI